MEILSTFVGKVLDFTVVPVGRQLGYVLFYSGNIKGLKKEAEKLEAARTDMERKVDVARNNNEEIKETAKTWMSEVDEITAKGEKFFVEESHANTGCSLRSCPNIWLRYKLSREAKKMTAEVAQVKGEVEKFGGVSTGQMRPQSFVVVGEVFKSRVSTMEEIMEALMDPTVHLIGLCGLGGIGKTTLAKQVAEKARERFASVLFVEVKRYSIKEIQNQIAYGVGLHFSTQSETESIRADQLLRRLKQEKSLLIVLDDLWKRLDFEQVGIPSAVEPNTQRKFIFTSRDAGLLCGPMNCKRNISVELLSEEEAWVLFKEMAEINEHSDHPDLVSKATEVSQKCARLPVAVVAVARALKNNKSLVDWEDALQRLKNYSSRNTSFIEEVDSSIKLSYDFLKPDELKPTFLLSAMFSQDPLIEDLVMYAIGLGFLGDVHNMEVARNRLGALVRQLKHSSLLLDSYSEDRFTIHDVVRDVALSIAFKEQHALVKRRERVDEWPNDDQLEKCTAIYLDESDIDELPEEFYGPKVEFFYLKSVGSKLSMQSNFFRGMPELKVLSLSEMTFSSLPSSISLLKKLVTLSLQSCILGDITVVEHLKKLKILNLSYSSIKELPCEVGQLSSLKVLNLSYCHQLKVIPPNLLSNLKKLEELYMQQSFDQWEAEGINEGKERASLDEVKHLQKLSTLEIDLPNASILPKNFLLESSLERYKISIGECVRDYFGYKFSRTLRLVANDNSNMEYGVFRLFEDVEDLHLRNLNGIASLYQSHITDQTFCKLRAIKVGCCDKLKSLFLVSMARALSRLETIEVSDCESLEEIVAFTDEENVLKGSTMNVIEFSQLRSLVLYHLPALTELCFSGKVLISLKNLEWLHIRDCDLLEVVFDFGQLNNYRETHTFRLKRLILGSLPKLKTVWGRGSQGVVIFPSLREVNASDCESLENIFPVSIAKGLSQLEELRISDCGIEGVVAKDEFSEPNATFVFPKLRKLEIRNCNKLKIFQSVLLDTKYSLFLDEKVIPKLEELCLHGMHAKVMCQFREFQFLNVKFLSLSKIYGKEATFLYSLLHGFPNLEELQLSDSFHEVIFSCSERPLDIDARKDILIGVLKFSEMKRLKHIWDRKCQVDHILQNLTVLDVSYCDELINLLTPSTARTLVQLTRLEIRGCKKIEEIITDGEEDVEKEIVFMKLKRLKLDGLSSFKSFCCHSYNFVFPLLDVVIIRKCTKFRMFCPGDLTTPLLKGVMVVRGKKPWHFNHKELHWQDNLNTTVQQLFDEKVLFKDQDVKIDEYPELIDIWNEKCVVSNPSFSSLTSLVVDKCAFLSYCVIPSYVLLSLINLRKLEVRNCDSVEAIFDLEGIDIDKEAHTLQKIYLSKLELRHLPNLKCIWNKDPHTDHCFRYLSDISAYECESLRSIFPASIVQGFCLSRLTIESCGIEFIVAEDNTPLPIIHFEIHLYFLRLVKLPNLKNFYPQRHTVEWPRLYDMDVRQCKKVKVFCWEDSKITEKETEDGVENQYPFFLFEKVIPNLKLVVFNQDHVKMIRNDQFQYDLFDGVWTLGLDGFNEDEQLIFPYAFLERFSKLKNLNVSHSSFKDIFPCHGPPIDPSRNVPSFTSLSLTHLDELQNIWNKDSKAYPVLQRLESLVVNHCYKLINLAPSSSASFDNLRELKVLSCHNLGYLLTTSTAKSLVCLYTLVVEDCKMMEEVVTNEGKDLEDVIRLNKLYRLELIDLPILKNFCGQTCTFEFPSLRNVTIRGCSKMKMFCPGVLATPLLENVIVDEDEGRWEENLNEILEQFFLEKESENSLEG